MLLEQKLRSRLETDIDRPISEHAKYFCKHWDFLEIFADFRSESSR